MDGSGDWNAALTDVDRGLRSTRVSDQAEAVAKLPQVFAKHPFPMFINAAMLKVMDVFRSGSNFMRECIVRVVKRCCNDLPKLLSKDDVAKKIFSVSHSNDPLARSLTLDLFALMAPIFPDKHNIHDFVRRSLESHHTGELRSGIKAAYAYSAVSQEFFDTIFDKIKSLLTSLAFPLELKQMLICIFKHAQPRQIELLGDPEDLLPSCPHLMLKVLVELSISSASGVTECVDKLINVFSKIQTNQEVDAKARLSLGVTLAGLQKLARRTPHHFTPEQMKRLVGLIRNGTKPAIIYRLIAVLNSLLESKMVQPSVIKDLLSDADMAVFKEHCCSSNNSLSLSSVQFLLSLANVQLVPDRSLADQSPSVRSLLADAENLFTTTVLVAERLGGAEPLFQAMLVFASKSKEVAERIVDCIMARLVSGGSLASDECSISDTKLLLKILSALLDKFPEILDTLGESLVDIWEMALAVDVGIAGVKDIRVMTGGLILATSEKGYLTGVDTISRLDPWTQYRLARAATRSGSYAFAVGIFGKLAAVTHDESCRWWLSGLQLVCEAEALIDVAADSDEQLSEAKHDDAKRDPIPLHDIAAKHFQALSHFRAADEVTTTSGVGGTAADASPSCGKFPQNFIRLRAQTLNVMDQIDLAVRQAQRLTADGRVLASTIADLMELLRVLRGDYADLKRRCFDADPQTHIYMDLWEGAVRLFGIAAEGSLTGNLAKAVEAKVVHLDCATANRSNRMLQAQIAKTQSSLATLSSPTLADVRDIFLKLIVSPLHLPRYLFQSQQRTTVNLQLSPSGFMTLSAGQNLVVKIEGIIDIQTTAVDGRCPTERLRKPLRRVSEVKLFVKKSVGGTKDTTLNSNSLSQSFGGSPSIEVVTKRIPLKRQDYFTEEMVFVPTSEKFTLDVTVELVDDVEQDLWATECHESLRVNVAGGLHHQQQGGSVLLGGGPTAAKQKRIG